MVDGKEDRRKGLGGPGLGFGFRWGGSKGDSVAEGVRIRSPAVESLLWECVIHAVSKGECGLYVEKGRGCRLLVSWFDHGRSQVNRGQNFRTSSRCQVQLYCVTEMRSPPGFR